MEPDKFQCVGRMIRVLNLSKTVERMFLVIEGNINQIIDLLLPVGRQSTGSCGLADGSWQLAAKQYEYQEVLFQVGLFYQK